MSTQPISIVDATRLEQLLQVQEGLLTGAVDDATLGDRICQSTALVLRAEGVRIVRLRSDGTIEERGHYGTPFAAADDALVREVSTQGQPVLGDATNDGRLLTVPVDAAPPLTMQLRPGPGSSFGLDHVGLARYAASLASVAFRHARTRTAGAARSATSDPGASEVLITLSHDLRQPLNVMLGYTQLLIDDTYGPCNEEQREALTRIERHARELHTVLTGALELARLERHDAEPVAEPFAMSDVLRELCTGSLAHRAPTDVALTWHADPATPELCSDRFRVRQVLQNLIDNALRHTEHGEVAVTARPYDRHVRLQVSDTGSGIAAADLPHVFAPFRTGTDGPKGSGLGLYIVKRFCESLGGEVSVDSQLGTGTRFTVDLPTNGPAR